MNQWDSGLFRSALYYPATFHCIKVALSYYRSGCCALSAPVIGTPLEMCASMSSCLKTLYSQTLTGKGYNFEHTWGIASLKSRVCCCGRKCLFSCLCLCFCTAPFPVTFWSREPLLCQAFRSLAPAPPPTIATKSAYTGTEHNLRFMYLFL